ncbi:MAG: RNA methyltransferase [bacterium]|nr:RNA methyltransferase [bacterium]
MPERAGAHSERIAAVRALLGAKGRREARAFTFEGPTLLAEAMRSDIAIEALYVTDTLYAKDDAVREQEDRGTPIFIVDDRTMAKISDLETPSGLVAVAPLAYAPLDAIAGLSLSLVLADLNDPGNAGTLLRSAEAFGADGVVFGRLGVDPYHPKVVRAAMGATFRLRLAVADPTEFAAAIAGTGSEVLGLEAGGDDIRGLAPAERRALIVGHERRGLGAWGALCGRRVAIPMPGRAESLNAAVAGSIALYETSRAGERPEGP